MKLLVCRTRKLILPTYIVLPESCCALLTRGHVGTWVKELEWAQSFWIQTHCSFQDINNWEYVQQPVRILKNSWTYLELVFPLLVVPYMILRRCKYSLFSPAVLGVNCHFKTTVAGAEWIGQAGVVGGGEFWSVGDAKSSMRWDLRRGKGNTNYVVAL